ncbi:hypothetical protein EUX98_g9299 [Antrodiella citrinella]|uniref:Uncharacterized protein n=1 Tax=Antrodiella citrinella TaxID=2447956 RepID=A0A4V3XF69_9APHY|nr:hypothetical protein EUX98_g9299 [Antrodiella citrinella]
MKTSSGDSSERIPALTNKHVASVDTTTDYEFDETNPQHILVGGDRCLARAVTEIEDLCDTLDTYRGVVLGWRFGALVDLIQQPPSSSQYIITAHRTR